MERKIGEIFEYNGEWYQCVEDTECIKCINCCFYNRGHKLCTDEDMGACIKEYRSDTKSICFKKLEKVGEPFTVAGRLHQDYKVFDNDNVCGDGFWCVHNYKAKTLTIEIKKNKEDMEEKDIKPYDKIFSQGTVSNTENLVTSSLKSFDLELAKAGKPVCTRDGRRARIICFDAKRKDKKSIIALVPSKDYLGFEDLIAYPNNGNYHGGHENDGDLMMLPEKKEGWAKIRKDINLYDTKEEADRKMIGNDEYVTAKVCWEE